MLKLIRSMRDLDFSRLMDVYYEGNLGSGSEFYPNLSQSERLLRAEQDFYAYLRVFFKTECAVYALWEEQGQYISALRLEPYQDGLLLAALETMPQFRRQGYGKKLILAALEAVWQDKKLPVYSHVHKRNLASLAIHRACGFDRISERAVYIDGSVTTGSCTLRKEPE